MPILYDFWFLLLNFEHFDIIWIQVFIRKVVCKNVISACDLAFHSPNSIFWRADSFSFNEARVIAEILQKENPAWLDSYLLSSLPKGSGVIVEICVHEAIIWICITGHHAAFSDLIFKPGKYCNDYSHILPGPKQHPSVRHSLIRQPISEGFYPPKCITDFQLHLSAGLMAIIQ